MSSFYPLAYEVSSVNTPVTVWSSHKENPLEFSRSTVAITKVEIESVPSAFQLLNVLSSSECQRLIDAAESMGFEEDSSISLPRSVRHNDNLVWVIDETFHDILWERCKLFFEDELKLYANKKALALNKRFRFYRYKKDDYFANHTDGAWPGSAVIEGKLINNAYKDRYSKMTFLLFLNDDYEGGKTQFLVDKYDATKPATTKDNVKFVNVATPKGAVLAFAHGSHPMHCLHNATKILNGCKYIIRSDVLFEL